MQKHILLLLFLHIATKGICQKTVFIDTYNLPAEIKAGQVIVEMPFGYADILKVSGDTAGLKTAGDIFIDVACTDYPINASLVSLNKSRVASFLKRFPFIEEGQLAQVNFFQQTDGALREKAITMFHGLIVTFRPKQTVENAKKEVVKLEEIVKTGTPGPEERSATAVTKQDSATNELEKIYAQRPRKFQNGKWYIQVGRGGIVSVDSDVPKKSPLDSFITRAPKDALEESLINKDEYKEFKGSTAIRIYYPHWVSEELLIPKKTVTVAEKPVVTIRTNRIPDTSILNILDRTKWQKATIVVDVTGSMYKYTAQLLLWVKTNPIGNSSKNFVFFNDGDNKPDKDKQIGNTGGIYYKTCNGYVEVEALMKSTMAKGGGGDYPENNIEALITGEKIFPAADFQVMIADNWAPIKDKIFWNLLTKPVRIVVCGATEFNVNIDYLNLARKTNGSVHLMESDLYNLSGLKEGEILKVGKNTFVVKNGVFVETGYDLNNK
ncbi:MAG: hypothetical protein IPP96_15430 [Chitinophagaceae bacterium]|nr:hypothetical protein [Chitinophagaceae bacterium]